MKIRTAEQLSDKLAEWQQPIGDQSPPCSGASRSATALVKNRLKTPPDKTCSRFQPT